MTTQLTQDKVTELKQRHGERLVGVEAPVEMVFKKPIRSVWADFQDAVSKDKGTREMAYRRLCLACLVFPELDGGQPAIDDVKSIFDEYPALPTKIGDKLGDLVGLGDDVELKKL
jgi:hypothetical protein